MITLTSGASLRHTLQPTIFPDGTSQVWKLPDYMMGSSSVSVDWRFEEEREIIDILSLKTLLGKAFKHLHVPYLPYAGQDKEVSNTTTFNLEVLGNLLNSMKLDNITAVDVHNPDRTNKLINNFSNMNATYFQREVITKSEANCIVFPDSGAHQRYKDLARDIPVLICDKTRDQLTGDIAGHNICEVVGNAEQCNRFLIVDDLCDGGATFISVAKLLRESKPYAKIDLCVTHGLFSKGKEHLLRRGIDKIYTTDSLVHNKGEHCV